MTLKTIVSRHVQNRKTTVILSDKHTRFTFGDTARQQVKTEETVVTNTLRAPFKRFLATSKQSCVCVVGKRVLVLTTWNLRLWGFGNHEAKVQTERCKFFHTAAFRFVQVAQSNASTRLEKFFTSVPWVILSEWVCPQTSVFTGKHADDRSVLLMVTNYGFRCHRGSVLLFRGQKRVFREKLALDTSGSESAGVLQPYSRAWVDGEKRIDSARKCTNIEDSTPI